jgi:hypothetical protein
VVCYPFIEPPNETFHRMKDLPNGTTSPNERSDGPAGWTGGRGDREDAAGPVREDMEDTEIVENIEDTEDTEGMEDTEDTDGVEDTEDMEVTEDKKEVILIIL